MSIGVAVLASLFVDGLISKWYVVPWLKQTRRVEALIALLWVHVFRYVVLFVISAQRDGYRISDLAVSQLVVGDLVGSVLAVVAIGQLRRHSRFGIALAWLLVAETLIDVIVGLRQRLLEPERSGVGGVQWMIIAFYLPALIVTVGLLIWQLYARRGESLARSVSGMCNASFGNEAIE